MFVKESLKPCNDPEEHRAAEPHQQAPIGAMRFDFGFHWTKFFFDMVFNAILNVLIIFVYAIKARHQELKRFIFVIVRASSFSFDGHVL